jgi:ribosomal protein L13E
MSKKVKLYFKFNILDHKAGEVKEFSAVEAKKLTSMGALMADASHVAKKPVKAVKPVVKKEVKEEIKEEVFKPSFNEEK